MPNWIHLPWWLSAPHHVPSGQLLPYRHQHSAVSSWHLWRLHWPDHCCVHWHLHSCAWQLLPCWLHQCSRGGLPQWLHLRRHHLCACCVPSWQLLPQQHCGVPVPCGLLWLCHRPDHLCLLWALHCSSGLLLRSWLHCSLWRRLPDWLLCWRQRCASGVRSRLLLRGWHQCAVPCRHIWILFRAVLCCL